MAKKNQKWIQKAVDRMEKKGTIGSFTEYCGGKITAQCVEKALNSPDPKIRKKAQFYVNVVKKELGGLIRYANGGMVDNNPDRPGLTETVGALNSIYGPAGAEALFANAMGRAEDYWRMYQTAAKYGMRVYAKGGSVYLAEDGMEVPVQQQAQAQPASQPSQASSPPQISYEQYVAFVTAYPEFLDRFLNELNQQLQNMESSGQGERGMEEQEESEPEMEEGGEIGGKPNPYDVVNKVKSVSDDLYGREFKNPNEFKEAFYQSVRNKIDPNIDRSIIDKITTDALNSSKSDKIRTASSYLESYLLRNMKEEGGETGDDVPAKSSYDFMEGLRDLLYQLKDRDVEDIATEVNNYLIDNNVGIDYVTLKQNIERSKEIARTNRNSEMPLVFINTMGDMILKRYNQAAEASKKKKGGETTGNDDTKDYKELNEDKIKEEAYNYLKEIEKKNKNYIPEKADIVRILVGNLTNNLEKGERVENPLVYELEHHLVQKNLIDPDIVHKSRKITLENKFNNDIDKYTSYVAQSIRDLHKNDYQFKKVSTDEIRYGIHLPVMLEKTEFESQPKFRDGLYQEQLRQVAKDVIDNMASGPYIKSGHSSRTEYPLLLEFENFLVEKGILDRDEVNKYRMDWINRKYDGDLSKYLKDLKKNATEFYKDVISKQKRVQGYSK